MNYKPLLRTIGVTVCIVIGTFIRLKPLRDNTFDKSLTFGLTLMFCASAALAPFFGWLAFEMLNLRRWIVIQLFTLTSQHVVAKGGDPWYRDSIVIIEWLARFFAASFFVGVGMVIAGAWSDMQRSLEGAGYALVCGEAWIGARYVVRRQRRKQSNDIEGD